MKEKHGHANKGKTSLTYSSWRHMRKRCLCISSDNYPYYGGRGIQICERWNSFKNFLADLGNRPSSNFTLERRDNEGNYCPENCFWATRKTQARNRRSSRYVTIDGETKLYCEWCEIYGIPQNIAGARESTLGWSAEKSITTPARRQKRNRLTDIPIRSTFKPS